LESTAICNHHCIRNPQAAIDVQFADPQICNLAFLGGNLWGLMSAVDALVSHETEPLTPAPAEPA
jgi:hypothetical protein